MGVTAILKPTLVLSHLSLCYYNPAGHACEPDSLSHERGCTHLCLPTTSNLLVKHTRLVNNSHHKWGGGRCPLTRHMDVRIIKAVVPLDWLAYSITWVECFAAAVKGGYLHTRGQASAWCTESKFLLCFYRPLWVELFPLVHESLCHFDISLRSVLALSSGYVCVQLISPSFMSSDLLGSSTLYFKMESIWSTMFTFHTNPLLGIVAKITCLHFSSFLQLR